MKCILQLLICRISLCFPECAAGASSALGTVQVSWREQNMERGGGSPCQSSITCSCLGHWALGTQQLLWLGKQASGQSCWQRLVLHHCCQDGETQAQIRNSGESAGIRAKEQTLRERWSLSMPSLELETGREGVPEPQLELLLPGCAALTSAWVIEISPEDQGLWVQVFLQQPKKVSSGSPSWLGVSNRHQT